MRSIDVDDAIALPSHQEVAVYRITQEALNNVWKHADTHRTSPSGFPEDTEVLLRVTDDGGGSTSSVPGRRPETSFGLLGIAERPS